MTASQPPHLVLPPPIWNTFLQACEAAPWKCVIIILILWTRAVTCRMTECTWSQAWTKVVSIHLHFYSIKIVVFASDISLTVFDIRNLFIFTLKIHVFQEKYPKSKSQCTSRQASTMHTHRKINKLSKDIIDTYTSQMRYIISKYYL